MKVRCINLIDASGKKVLSSPWFTLDKVYTVLSLFIDSDHCIKLRLLADQSPAGIISSLDEFELVDKRIPPNWVINYNEKILELQPARWAEPKFWANYFDGVPEAERIFEEELKTILSI